MVKSTSSSAPRQDVFSTKRSSQLSSPGLKHPEDTTRRSRLMTSKRREPEEQPESKRLLSVCLLMKSEESKRKEMLTETRTSNPPRRSSEKETSRRCNRRRPLPSKTRLPPPKLQLSRTLQSRKSKRVERNEQSSLNDLFK